MKTTFTILVILSAMIICSCSTTIPGGLAESNYPLQTKNYQLKNTVEGIDTGVTIFGFLTLKKAYLHNALSDAQIKAQTNKLINLEWSVTTTNWVILPVVTEKYTVKAQGITIKEGGK